MASVTVENLVKRFEEVVAVDGVTFEVADREFVVLLGASGSGKTTTLRCVAGLEMPDAGRLAIDGREVTRLAPADRDVAFVFQFYALYPHMSVFDNLAFPLRARRMAKAEIERRVREVAQVLHIEHLLRRPPHKLSGGEMQRVALGRAMVRQPKVFLMDEPLTNLDAKLRAEMRAKLKRDQTDLGATTIYVTHDQVEAMSMGDRIAVMDAGRIQQMAAPDEVYNRPANLFVAGFIGAPAMNFIEARLGAVDGAPVVVGESDPLHVKLDAEQARRLESAQGLVLGVRPEDVHLDQQPREGWFEVEVYVTEPLGPETIIDVALGPRETARILRARTPPTFVARIGQRLWMSLDPQRVHYFDRATGAALR